MNSQALTTSNCALHAGPPGLHPGHGSAGEIRDSDAKVFLLFRKTKEDSSFLKKRSKRLLLPALVQRYGTWPERWVCVRTWLSAANPRHPA
jgi:hypothetical protein